MVWSKSSLYGQRHRKLRALLLAYEPVCRVCKRALATEADHIVPRCKGGGDDLDNLQPLCRPCHAEKTARESVEAKGHRHKLRVVIGSDGWPVR
ncbi:MAG: HNH endonuclease signature motif containing protein [Novosphingobium meiothermophilum]